MAKKEFTKKQLRKQLTTLTEARTARSESELKGDMKKSFDALKKLDQVMTGQKIGDVTITKAMNKKIKNAKRYIEDLWDKITDGEIEEKETSEGKEVEEKNAQSEGHGKMYNALEGVREGKIIKMNQSTLKRIVERVISESATGDGEYDITELGGDAKIWPDSFGSIFYLLQRDNLGWDDARSPFGWWFNNAVVPSLKGTYNNPEIDEARLGANTAEMLKKLSKFFADNYGDIYPEELEGNMVEDNTVSQKVRGYF